MVKKNLYYLSHLQTRHDVIEKYTAVPVSV